MRGDRIKIARHMADIARTMPKPAASADVPQVWVERAKAAYRYIDREGYDELAKEDKEHAEFFALARTLRDVH